MMKDATTAWRDAKTAVRSTVSKDMTTVKVAVVTTAKLRLRLLS